VTHRQSTSEEQQPAAAQGNQKHFSWVEHHGGVAGLGLGYRLCSIVGHSGGGLG